MEPWVRPHYCTGTQELSMNHKGVEYTLARL